MAAQSSASSTKPWCEWPLYLTINHSFTDADFITLDRGTASRVFFMLKFQKVLKAWSTHLMFHFIVLHGYYPLQGAILCQASGALMPILLHHLLILCLCATL